MTLLQELKLFVENTKTLVGHASLSALYESDQKEMKALVEKGNALLAKLAVMEASAPTWLGVMKEHQVMANEIRRMLGNFDLLPKEQS